MDDWSLPSIDMARCTRCGLCVEYCPTHAVTMVKDTLQITSPRSCSYCGLCEDLCPEDAIVLSYIIMPYSVVSKPYKEIIP